MRAAAPGFGVRRRSLAVVVWTGVREGRAQGNGTWVATLPHLENQSWGWDFGKEEMEPHSGTISGVSTSEGSGTIKSATQA